MNKMLNIRYRTKLDYSSVSPYIFMNEAVRMTLSIMVPKYAHGYKADPGILNNPASVPFPLPAPSSSPMRHKAVIGPNNQKCFC